MYAHSLVMLPPQNFVTGWNPDMLIYRLTGIWVLGKRKATHWIWHKDLVNILDKALDDGHPPQNNGPICTDSSSGKLNYTNEVILRKSVCYETPRFVDNSDLNTLSSHLYSRNLVHSSDYETLTSMQSNRERGKHFYMKILPRKGRHTYRRLYIWVPEKWKRTHGT